MQFGRFRLVGRRPKASRAVVALPEPDSPTMPSVSPRTARTNVVDGDRTLAARAEQPAARDRKRSVQAIDLEQQLAVHVTGPVETIRSLTGCADRTQWPGRTSRSSGVTTPQSSSGPA